MGPAELLEAMASNRAVTLAVGEGLHGWPQRQSWRRSLAENRPPRTGYAREDRPADTAKKDRIVGLR